MPRVAWTPLVVVRLPLKELLPAPLIARVLVTVKPLETSKLPAKELEEVALPWENCLAIDSPPAKEDEPVPNELKRPVVSMAAAWRPLVRLRLHAKELLPVPYD